VGAQRAQVIRGAVAEAAMVGLVAGALGVLAGVAISAAAVAALGDRFADVPLAMPDLTASALVLPWLAGTLVTVVSAVLPAVRASWVEPLAALRMDDRIDVRSRAGALRLLAAVAAVAVGAAALVAGASSGLVPVGVAGGMVSFVGVLWAGPVLVPGAVRLLGQPARLAGLPGRLALANSARNPRRTAATALALLVGVTLISMLTIGTASSQSSSQRLNDDYHPIDMAVSARTSFDASVLDQLQTVEGVDASAVLQGAPLRIGGRSVRVAGVDPAEVDTVLRSQVGVLPGPREILVPFAAMNELGVEPGSELTVRGAGERVALVVRAGDAWGEPLLVSAVVLDRLATTLAPAAVWLHVDDDADPAAAKAAVESIAEADRATVAGGLDVRVQLEQVLSVVVAVAAGLLGVAVLIALVGVSNTLSLSVLERTRENALLRALGLSSVHMRAMLAFEALLLTAVAALLGITLGAAYAWFGVQTLLGPQYGSDIVFRLPWGQLGLVIAVAVLAGLVASWLPARRAARTPPVAAL
jgi:putative ABC transport system permease protein